MPKTQLELIEELQSKGYNVVTCGDCGSVLIHKTPTDSISCPHCGFDSEPSSFPDLFYPNWDSK